MPFKLKLIKEFQKNFRFIKEHEESGQKLQIVKDQQRQQKTKSKQKKKLIYKNFSLFQLILTKELTENQHVINFYNIIAINQKAIRDPCYDQSLFTTVFYIKNVKKVEIKSNIVILHLANTHVKAQALQYIIERFKSFGDLRFYNLANLLIEAAKRLKIIDEMEVSQNVEDNSQFLDKYIESMGNRMYYCRASVNKVVFSRSLLDLLQYNVEDFALDCVRFRGCLTEFISAQPYFDVIYMMMENVRNLFDLLGDKISLETFLDSSLIRFKEFMYTKNNKKLYCKLKIGMPNPMINLFQIEEVINRTDDLPLLNNSQQKKKQIQSMKQQRQQNQINHIRKVINLPKNLLPEYQRLVSGYCNQSSLKTSNNQ